MNDTRVGGGWAMTQTDNHEVQAKWAAEGPVHVSCAFLRRKQAPVPDVLPHPLPAGTKDNGIKVPLDDNGGIHGLIGRRDRLAETVRSMEERLMRKGYLTSTKKSPHHRGYKDPGDETDESLNEWLNDEGMEDVSEERSSTQGEEENGEEDGKMCDVTAFKICAPGVPWPGLVFLHKTWEVHMEQLFNGEEGLKAVGIPPPQEHLISFLTDCFMKEDLSSSTIRAKLPELLRGEYGEWRWEDSHRTELPLPWIDEPEDVHWANFVLVCKPQNNRLFQQHWLHTAEKTQLPAILEAKRQAFEKLMELKMNTETSKAIYLSGEGGNAEPWIAPLRALKGLFCLEQRLSYAMEIGFMPRWQTPKFRTKRERKDFCVDVCSKLQGGNPEMVSYLLDDDGTGPSKPMIVPPPHYATMRSEAPKRASAGAPVPAKPLIDLDTSLHDADMLVEENAPRGTADASRAGVGAGEVRSKSAAPHVLSDPSVPGTPGATRASARTSGGTDAPGGETQNPLQRPLQHLAPHREAQQHPPQHPLMPSHREDPRRHHQQEHQPRHQQHPAYHRKEHSADHQQPSQPARQHFVAALPAKELKNEGNRANRVASRPFDHPDGRPRAGDIVSTKDNDINVKVVRVYVDIRTDSFGQPCIAAGGPYDIEMCDGGTLRLPLRKLQGALKWSVDEFCMVYNDDNWAHALVHEVPSSDKHAPYSLILETGRRVHRPLLYLRTYQGDAPPFNRDVARALSRAFDAFVIKETLGGASVSAAKMEELCMRWEAIPEEVKRTHLPKAPAMSRCRPTLCAGQDVTIVDGHREARGTVVSVKATTVIVATHNGGECEVPRENVLANKMLRRAGPQEAPEE
eukprot:GEMP01005388.1.p1 GENE.GEMP01005388.1~~GEMP01005388.1.p1  ORF type:complete len:853 (+),score=276.50 GEMP01005388.1:227-2785(+)